MDGPFLPWMRFKAPSLQLTSTNSNFFLTLLRLFDRILIAGAVNFSSLGFLAKRRMNWVGSGCIRVW